VELRDFGKVRVWAAMEPRSRSRLTALLLSVLLFVGLAGKRGGSSIAALNATAAPPLPQPAPPLPAPPPAASAADAIPASLDTPGDVAAATTRSSALALPAPATPVEDLLLQAVPLPWLIPLAVALAARPAAPLPLRLRLLTSTVDADTMTSAPAKSGAAQGVAIGAARGTAAGSSISAAALQDPATETSELPATFKAPVEAEASALGTLTERLELPFFPPPLIELFARRCGGELLL